MLCEGCNRLSIVLTCGCVIFSENRGKNLRFQEYSDTCRRGVSRTLSNDRLLFDAALPVYARILQTVTAVNIAFSRALNPHVKIDNKRDFTKEAKLLLDAILVITLILCNMS